MTNYIVVNVFKVSKGKNSNWLKFTITVGGVNDNREFDVDFCGTELNGGSLYGDMREIVKNELVSDYGYPPYDIKKCNQILKQKNCYTIEVEDEIFN